jgi:uncharacterized protein (DUF1501 family)
MTLHTRRQFLKTAAAAGVVGAAANPWLQMHAMAQEAASGASDYKALICLFLYGGNDGNNLLMPLANPDYALYATARGGLALPRPSGATPLPGEILPIAPTNKGGTPYGLHPALTGIKGLFDAGQAALLANIGPLIVPTTSAQFHARSVPLPSNLFSHSDQQNLWQTDSFNPALRGGWGGRMVERVVDTSVANRGYSCVSVSGGALWGTGDVSLLPYRVPASGSFGLNGYTPGGSDPFSMALGAMLNESRADVFEATWLQVLKRATDNQRILAEALTGKEAATVFPTSELGQQLKMISRLMAARGSLGLKRQCFFCSIGGFDTHGGEQRGVQQNKFSEIDAAIKAFTDEMNAQGLGQQVTLFTASDFGRTFLPNGNTGTDHGWGNHHLVVGGAVQGGKVYGELPGMAMTGPEHIGSGNWIPKLALDSFGAELGRWFGVGSALGEVFPQSGNFDASLSGLMA